MRKLYHPVDRDCGEKGPNRSIVFPFVEKCVFIQTLSAERVNEREPFRTVLAQYVHYINGA